MRLTFLVTKVKQNTANKTVRLKISVLSNKGVVTSNARLGKFLGRVRPFGQHDLKI
jgi:hypothetical protein